MAMHRKNCRFLKVLVDRFCAFDLPEEGDPVPFLRREEGRPQIGHPLAGRLLRFETEPES